MQEVGGRLFKKWGGAFSRSRGAPFEKVEGRLLEKWGVAFFERVFDPKPPFKKGAKVL